MTNYHHHHHDYGLGRLISQVFWAGVVVFWGWIGIVLVFTYPWLFAMGVIISLLWWGRYQERTTRVQKEGSKRE